jgi:hypothetical protein
MNVPEMTEAFSTRWGARVFGFFVALVLLLPSALTNRHFPDHDERLPSVPINAGPYSFLQQQVYGETSDVDLAFVGDSLLWVGIDAPKVAEALTRSLGRPARVITLGWNWAGEDLTYYVLRDMLARRRVRAVVFRLRLPWESELAERPHKESYRFLTRCEHDPVLPTLPLPLQAAAFNLEAIGVLRNLLSLLRPDRLSASPYAATLGAYEVKLGPNFGPFVAAAPAHREFSPGETMSTLGASPTLKASRDASGEYERAYMEATRRLLDGHQVRVAFVRAPDSIEANDAAMEIDGAYARIFGSEATVLAIAPNRLYEGMTREQVANFYYDGRHFNANGNAYFTRALLPALLDFSNALAAP